MEPPEPDRRPSGRAAKLFALVALMSVLVPSLAPYLTAVGNVYKSQLSAAAE